MCKVNKKYSNLIVEMKKYTIERSSKKKNYEKIKQK